MILRNYLWLTRNVLVLKGALIAEGGVIGHSSVVTGRCQLHTPFTPVLPRDILKKELFGVGLGIKVSSEY